MAKNDFQYGGWNSYTLHYGMIMTLISPGDCTICGMWFWNHDSEFTLLLITVFGAIAALQIRLRIDMAR